MLMMLLFMLLLVLMLMFYLIASSDEYYLYLSLTLFKCHHKENMDSKGKSFHSFRLGHLVMMVRLKTLTLESLQEKLHKQWCLFDQVLTLKSELDLPIALFVFVFGLNCLLTRLKER